MARLDPSYSRAVFASALRGRRPARFGVVTACNPRGRTRPAEDNAAADRRLKARLVASRRPHFRVTGGSRDGSHREPGWGVVAEGPAPIRSLAVEFRQLGYYWIDSGRVLLGAAAGGPLRRVGTWSRRRARWTGHSFLP